MAYKSLKQILVFYPSLLILLFLLMHHKSSGQNKKDSYIPTPNTVKDAPPDPRKQGVKEKKIRYIITNSTKNTLAGNACFEESTRKMGFQYLAIPKGQAPNTSGWNRWWHNFGVKTVVLFKNGPFWKTKVNKNYKNCKFQSGDYVG